MHKPVPNIFPKIDGQPYRIALVGEAPGKDEVEAGIPFVGYSGQLLNNVMSKCGILRDACFIGNVCQIQPYGNQINLFKWDGPEIRSGIAQLETDLRNYKPNLIVLLGGTALKWAKGGEKESIENWRGSLMQSNGWKCLPTIHPAAVLREYSYMPLLRFDMKRAAQEGRSPELNLPSRNLITNLTTEQIICRLEQIKNEKPTISIDIEGGIDSMSCLSIATTAEHSFIVPFTTTNQLSCQLWTALAAVLCDPTVPKILQNSLYDLFVLQYSYHIPVRGVVDDTMLRHWELYCELPKSLGFQASIYTREPYYKEDRHAEDRTTFYEYCCRDSAVTFEINSILAGQLNGDANKNYRLNLSLLEPLLYMELKGINYDKTKAQTKLAEVTHQTHRLQWALNTIAGVPEEKWLETCADALTFKKQRHLVRNPADLVTFAKPACLADSLRAEQLLTKDRLSLADRGELSIITEHCLNVESKTQLPYYLYDVLKYPIQYKKEGGKLTTKKTTDVLALLTLWKKTSDPTIRLILTVRSLRTRSSSLAARTDGDGRIRCAYNIVGTTTGRLSCYESPTGSGFNLQTVTKKDRDLFLPDDGYWLFQCDLSGADGWTVAAHCYAAGDPTMLDDYNQGLKPARLIALMYNGQSLANRTRDELRAMSKEVDDDSWLYFACKRVQHGSNYGMKERTMADQILKDSYKIIGEPIYIEPPICARLQQLYLQRYPGVLRWHCKIKQQLKQYGYIISASGHKRIFFGRRDDHKTFTDACAEEPQNNTTHANNLALWRLWSDKENRIQDIQTNRLGMGGSSGFRADTLQQRGDLQPNKEVAKEGKPCNALNGFERTSLRVQPLHHIHDALVGQFRKEDVDWARPKIRGWYNNTLTIAGQPIIIPFEGKYGRSWGELTEGKI